MDEAKRLNMLDGHFFWIWIDASTDFDVFQNISNRTNFDGDIEEKFQTSRLKKEALKSEAIERKKRDADNNTIENVETPSVGRKRSQVMNNNNIDKNNSSVRNESKNFTFRRGSRNINKFETHINHKLLYVNFSQSFDSSRNISEYIVRNYNIKNKGVETSKIEINSIEKENKSFPNRNTNRRTSSSKLKNESFNKYVNSINLNELYESKNVIFDEEIVSSIDNKDLRDSVLFSSDISDFIMNPTVHTSTINNVREKEKKYEYRMEQDDEPITEVNDSITEMFNSLPVGLLALYPHPMKIGKYLEKYLCCSYHYLNKTIFRRLFIRMF